MNERYKFIWIIAVVGVLMTILAFNREHIDDELVGVWKLESTQTNGQPRRRERELWVFRNGTLTIVSDGRTNHVKISLAPVESPKHIDTDIVLQPTGIYEIDDDTLRIAQVVPNMPRPNEFKTIWGDLRTVSILRRVDSDSRKTTDQLNDLLLTEFGTANVYQERMEFDDRANEFISDLMRDIYDKAGERNPKEEVVYQVSWLITEVNNGGFHQYFYNSSGDNSVKIVGFLRNIGAPETATLVEIGCKLFPDGSPSEDYRKRRKQLEQFSLDQLETLRDLQERFYSRREDLNVLLKAYWEDKP